MISEDTSLIMIVHKETVGAFHLSANITRFGGLNVNVYDTSKAPDFCVWQGDNIILARMWIRMRQKADAEVIGAVAL